MSDQEHRSLAEAWIKYHYLPESEKETSNLFSAWVQLDNLVEDQPQAAWEVIQQLCTLDQTEHILANIAAGPVENLLCSHGSSFIERIEQLAKKDPVVRKMLGAVWGRNRMAADVWQRLQAVAGPSF
jgi:uncharacterized protein DUF6869